MKKISWKNTCSTLTKVLQNVYIQAFVVGIALILPFIGYVALTGKIIAPLNVMPGWEVVSTPHEVVSKIPSDVNQQMLPFRQYTQDALQRGDLPLWNSKVFAGDTFFANPINMALSPLNGLLYITDIYTFQNILVLFGMFLMGASAYLLIRQLSFSLYAGIIGAIAYVYAPFSVFWAIYGIVSIPMAAIPLVLFLYYRWRDHPKKIDAYLASLALVLGIVVYMGHIQVTLLPYGILFLAVAYDLLKKRLKFNKSLFLGLGVFLALIIASGQLVATALQTPASHRSSEVIAVDPKAWPDRIDELSRITAPYNLANGPEDLGVSTRRELTVGQVPGMLLVVSLLVLVLSLMRRKSVGFPYFYLFLFVFGAFWQWNDFPQTFLNIISPTFRSLAGDYFLPIALLGMSVLAAFSLDWIIRTIFRRRTLNKKIFINYILAIPLLGFVILLSAQIMLPKIPTLNETYFTWLYLIFVALLILYIYLRHIKSAKMYFAATIITLALFQGWALYRVTQPIVSSDNLAVKNKTLDQLTKTDPGNPTIVDYTGPQESILYNVSLINGYDSLYSDSIQHRIKAINSPNITPPSYRSNSLLINTQSKPTLFKNLGIAYTINQVPKSGYDKQADNTFKADQDAPRVYFAKSVTTASRDEQLEIIKSGDVAYHEVIIDGRYPIANEKSKVSYSFSTNTVSITTDSSNGGLLFIAQTYNPDWSAQTDDSKGLLITPAYYDFSAINVPAGKHTITLSYSPRTVLTGLVISLLGIIVIVTFFIWLVIHRHNVTKSK